LKQCVNLHKNSGGAAAKTGRAFSFGPLADAATAADL